MTPFAAGVKAVYEKGRRDGDPGLIVDLLAVAGAVMLAVRAWDWWKARQARTQAQAQVQALRYPFGTVSGSGTLSG